MAALKFEDVQTSNCTSEALSTNVSCWHLQNLTSLGISYSKNSFTSPLEVLDSVPFICKDVSDNCESLINYLTDCIDFTISTNKHGIIFEESQDEHLTRRREYRSDVARRMVETIDQNLNKLKLNYSTFEEAGSLVFRDNIPLIYAAAIHFILRVREFVVRTFKGDTVDEQFFTDLMLKFGEIFCLISDSGGSKRRFYRVGDIMVTSVPDIRYSLMDLRDLPFQTVAVASVVKVKKMSNFECNCVNHPESRSHQTLNCADDQSTTSDHTEPSTVATGSDTASASSVLRHCHFSTTATVSSTVTSTEYVVLGSSSSRLSDFNINTLDPTILGEHGGELLAEYEIVATRPYVIGMIVHGTKIIVTCLKLQEDDYNEIKQNGKLPDDHSVNITYSRPFDVFYPEDRKILYRVFFRLSDKCCANSSTS
ncbi:RP-L14 [Mytilus coruscus]|uniref:RP-L14 n=1 Tax=Mytilus coruscus TaxID=42192 RepID=A0A6J8E255_MYTCO|nr:RP-L14 [Mytilus coruscus]